MLLIVLNQCLFFFIFFFITKKIKIIFFFLTLFPLLNYYFYSFSSPNYFNFQQNYSKKCSSIPKTLLFYPQPIYNLQFTYSNTKFSTTNSSSTSNNYHSATKSNSISIHNLPLLSTSRHYFHYQSINSSQSAKEFYNQFLTFGSRKVALLKELFLKKKKGAFWPICLI